VAVRTLSLKPALALAAFTSVLACDNSSPCTTCPRMEGNWVFGYSARPFEGNCDGVPAFVPPGTLTITRAGASIHSSTGGIALSGTIYDDNEFVLRANTFAGDGGSTTLYFRGQYVAGTASADGGTNAADAQLTGDFSATVRGATSDCRMPSDFTAVR
jgi:hypothetical protein